MTGQLNHGSSATPGLDLVAAHCCVCGRVDGEPVGLGEDFEYRTSTDTFLALRCAACQLVYLDPRPATSEFPRIYPDDYHAFGFSAERFGLVYKVRRRLEARRLLALCTDLPPDAVIMDIGCGDGFHLSLLKDFGNPAWRLQGVDLDPRAAAAAADSFVVHVGDVQELDLPQSAVDLALMIQTIEHLADPAGVLSAVLRLLKPGGRLLVVTDNTDSPDFRIFKSRYWGGYHFPRHWSLFNKHSLESLAIRNGFEVEWLRTMVSPVNWTYSIRNMLDDLGAPGRLVEFFSLSSPAALAFFTAFDAAHQCFGRGALLRAMLRRPR